MSQHKYGLNRFGHMMEAMIKRLCFFFSLPPHWTMKLDGFPSALINTEYEKGVIISSENLQEAKFNNDLQQENRINTTVLPQTKQ